MIFSNSFRHSNCPRVSIDKPSRALSSSIPVRTTREEEGSSLGNPKNIKLTGVRSYTNVARPFYTEENESTRESQYDESPVMSPTYSCYVITKTYSVNHLRIGRRHNKGLILLGFLSRLIFLYVKWSSHVGVTSNPC